MVYLMRKKFLQGVLTLGMAAAICFGASAVRADAAVDMNKIKVDGAKQTMTISGLTTTDSEFLVGFATKGQKSGKTVFKVASWDVYTPVSNTVTVDLSNLNSTKDNYVELKYQNGDIAIVKIPAAAKKCIATYDPISDTLEVKAGASKAAATAAAKFEYRTAVGSWSSAQDLASGKKADVGFELYQPQGATLYVRVPGTYTDGGDAIAKNDELKDVYEADNLTDKIAETYQSVSLPTKEAKLKIAKQAKSPKVAVNYAKGEVTIPAKTEYRVYGSAATSKFIQDGESVKYVSNGSKASKKVSDLLKDGSTTYEKGFIEVRTAANTTKKKAASKWAHIDMIAPAKIIDAELAAIAETPAKETAGFVNSINDKGTTVEDKAATTGNVVTKADGGTLKYGGHGIKYAQITNGKTDATKEVFVTAKYGTVDAKKECGQVILENKGEKTYQVVVKESKTATVSDSDKASTLKPNGTLTLKNLKTNQWVFIREAGVQKTKEWVGEYKVMGVVDIPLTKVYEKPADE